METGDLIYLILMIAVGIFSAIRSKKKKTVTKSPVFFEESNTEPFGFEQFFKDPEQVEEEIQQEYYHKEEEIVIPEPAIIEQTDRQKKISSQKLEDKEEMALIYGSDQKIEEYDYNDSDIANININDDIKIDEEVEFDLKEAIIYSEILNPKYI